MTKHNGESKKGSVKRRSNHDKVGQDIKSIYDDVVSEPVPDEMADFDKPKRKLES